MHLICIVQQTNFLRHIIFRLLLGKLHKQTLNLGKWLLGEISLAGSPELHSLEGRWGRLLRSGLLQERQPFEGGGGEEEDPTPGLGRG